MSSRYLTKSRFKLARECTTKLFYTGKDDEYANQNLEDTFLAELAEGGFQVGELAKCYYPGGHEITTRKAQEALRQTNELLQLDSVVIFEAALCYKNLFCHADILVKENDFIQLIEVKAKSFNSSDTDIFVGGKGDIKSGWRSYLEDVAFQKYVISNALPGYTVNAYLMMADKDSLCPTNGLNQKFKVRTNEKGRKEVVISPPVNDEDLAVKILGKVCVNEYCDMLINNESFEVDGNTFTFAGLTDYYADIYARDEKVKTPPFPKCGSCEFRASANEKNSGLKSGFEECWQEQLHWEDADFLEPTVLDIWNFRGKEGLMSAGIIKMADVPDDAITLKSNGSSGISNSERQLLQIHKVKDKDNSYWLDKKGLVREMENWNYPLHFIDFETSKAAIPFNKGRRPYEDIAFQFSHHVIIDKAGRVEHRGEYINATPGFFPNYEFVRRLKEELDKDSGSVFRYAEHENTILNAIHRQLEKDSAIVPDYRELQIFIESITHLGPKGKRVRQGARDMIDLRELVVRYYYDPATGGKNSIKQVLPTILNSSDYLQKKYSAPIYGAEGGIKSLNYSNWKWIEYDENGAVKDPYQLLPSMFEDLETLTPEERAILDSGSLFSDTDELHDGGAALTAYGKLQFEEMSDYERREITAALKKYCELDTLAMVMIVEGWREMIR